VSTGTLNSAHSFNHELTIALYVLNMVFDCIRRAGSISEQPLLETITALYRALMCLLLNSLLLLLAYTEVKLGQKVRGSPIRPILVGMSV